jgi:hypothetical protein
LNLVTARLQSTSALSEAWCAIVTTHATISGEVSAVKNGRALSPSHFGKSFLHNARSCSRELLSTPSGLSGVFKIKGNVGATSTAREIRVAPCRVT